MTPDAELSDAILTGRAARGDERAFAALVARYKEVIYRFIRRYVGEPEDAYDLLQQTFVSAWLAIARYDTRRPLRTWLQTIALNKCRDHGRKMKIRRLFFGVRGDGEAEKVADQRLNAEEDLIRDEALRALNAAIAGLPRQLKEPLLLTVFGDLSQSEAGRQLGISAKAVETRISRARHKLAETLGHMKETRG